MSNQSLLRSREALTSLAFEEKASASSTQIALEQQRWGRPRDGGGECRPHTFDAAYEATSHLGRNGTSSTNGTITDECWGG